VCVWGGEWCVCARARAHIKDTTFAKQKLHLQKLHHSSIPQVILKILIRARRISYPSLPLFSDPWTLRIIIHSSRHTNCFRAVRNLRGLRQLVKFFSYRKYTSNFLRHLRHQEKEKINFLFSYKNQKNNRESSLCRSVETVCLRVSFVCNRSREIERVTRVVMIRWKRSSR